MFATGFYYDCFLFQSCCKSRRARTCWPPVLEWCSSICCANAYLACGTQLQLEFDPLHLKVILSPYRAFIRTVSTTLSLLLQLTRSYGRLTEHATLMLADDAGVTCTPAVGSALDASNIAALTPLCLDLDNLQLSAESSRPAASTPASTANGDGDSASPATAHPFSLPRGIGPAGETPALHGGRLRWNRSVFEAPGE